MDGQLVLVTGAGGDLSPAMRKNLHVHFVHLEDAKHKLDKLRPLLERGQLRSVIGKSFPLQEVAAAHKLLEQGGAAVHGKIVIKVR